MPKGELLKLVHKKHQNQLTLIQLRLRLNIQFHSKELAYLQAILYCQVTILYFGGIVALAA